MGYLFSYQFIHTSYGQKDGFIFVPFIVQSTQDKVLAAENDITLAPILKKGVVGVRPCPYLLMLSMLLLITIDSQGG